MLLRHLQHWKCLTPFEKTKLDDLRSQKTWHDNGVQFGLILRIKNERLLTSKYDLWFVGVQAFVQVGCVVDEWYDALHFGGLLYHKEASIDSSVVFSVWRCVRVLDIAPFTHLDYLVWEENLLLANRVRPCSLWILLHEEFLTLYPAHLFGE